VLLPGQSDQSASLKCAATPLAKVPPEKKLRAITKEKKKWRCVFMIESPMGYVERTDRLPSKMTAVYLFLNSRNILYD
jgi:hypothetical protein